MKPRDFATKLLARFKVTTCAQLKSAPTADAKPRARHGARQTPAFKPKPSTYRPASNM